MIASGICCRRRFRAAKRQWFGSLPCVRRDMTVQASDWQVLDAMAQAWDKREDLARARDFCLALAGMQSETSAQIH